MASSLESLNELESNFSDTDDVSVSDQMPKKKSTMNVSFDDTDSLMLDTKCIAMHNFSTKISKIFRGIAPGTPMLQRGYGASPQTHLPLGAFGLWPLNRLPMSHNGEIKSWQP